MTHSNPSCFPLLSPHLAFGHRPLQILNPHLFPRALTPGPSACLYIRTSFVSPKPSPKSPFFHTKNPYFIRSIPRTATPNTLLPMAAAALDKSVPETLPPSLEATADQPPLFDGTTRLYTAYICPFAQRVWITRNFKGLQDEIQLVPLILSSRPAWYAEKVYPPNKVPSLEHNGKIIGESLDLIKYVDSNFEGPSLLPDDPAKKEFAEELFSYTDTLNRIVFTSLKGDVPKEAGPAFDYLENALKKFDDGPFFLGQFSLVDIAYIPFVERFKLFLSEVLKYDITAGRPKLAAWIEELDKIEGYKQTKVYDPKEVVDIYKKRFLAQ